MLAPPGNPVSYFEEARAGTIAIAPARGMSSGTSAACYCREISMIPMNKWLVRAAGMALVFTLAGCGSSNSGPGGPGSGGAGGTKGGTGTAGCSAMSWLDDGASECADLLSVTRSTKGGFDQLVVVGSETTNVGLTFKVIVPGGAIELGKDYTCDGAYILFVYQAGALPSHSTKSCTLTVSALGSATTPAAGTFSATLLASDGVTIKQITQGAFSAVPTIAN